MNTISTASPVSTATLSTIRENNIGEDLDNATDSVLRAQRIAENILAGLGDGQIAAHERPIVIGIARKMRDVASGTAFICGQLETIAAALGITTGEAIYGP